MNNIQIVSKETHQTTANLSSNMVRLDQNASVVVVQASTENVAQVMQQGTSVIIQFKDGQTLEIKDFYSTAQPTNNSLVFDDGTSQLMWARLTDDQGAFYPQVQYVPLNSIDPLLDQDGSNIGPYWMWLTLLVGGITVAYVADDLGHGSSGGDTTPPAAPIINPVASGRDNTPSISGTAEPNSNITVVIRDTTGNIINTGTATTNANGDWTYTPVANLPDGNYNVTATAKDPAGNTSPNSSPQGFEVDTTAPATPTVPVSATDDVTPVLGSITEGQTTNDNTPTFQGSGTANDIIKIYDGATLLGSTTVNSSGAWTFAPSTPLADGQHAIRYTESDKYGNESGFSPTLNFTVDATPGNPGEPLTITDDVDLITGVIANNGLTNDNRPTFSGTGSANEVITIFDGNTAIGSTTVNAAGLWQLTPTTPMSDGSHTVSYNIRDVAGNVSARSAETVFTIDSQAPSAVAQILNISDDTGTAGDFITRDTSISVNGTVSGLNTDDVVQISTDGTTWVNVPVSAGAWSFVDSRTLTDGTYTYRVRVVDAAGNTSPVISQVVTVDTVAPQQLQRPHYNLMMMSHPLSV